MTAKESADGHGLMVVIYRKAAQGAVAVHLCFRLLADGAQPLLRCMHLVVLLLRKAEFAAKNPAPLDGFSVPALSPGPALLAPA